MEHFLYYITFVNDVYAQFLTGASNNVFKAPTFPTTQSELDDIKEYATKKR